MLIDLIYSWKSHTSLLWKWLHRDKYSVSVLLFFHSFSLTRHWGDLFEPMGLSLSVWKNHRVNDRPPTSSSAFLPLTVPTSFRFAVTLSSPLVATGDGCSHWSSVQQSPNFLLSPCKQEVTHLPVEQSSDGMRAEIGVRNGLGGAVEPQPQGESWRIRHF